MLEDVSLDVMPFPLRIRGDAVPRTEQVAALLIDVESGLRQLNLWELRSPPAEALASTQPFCIDTLNFAQSI